MSIYKNHNDSGIALFMVLWVLVLLSVIVGEFCYAMRTEINITKNLIDTEKAYYIAKAGLNRAILGLLYFDNVDAKVETEGLDEPVWRVNTYIKEEKFGNGKFKIVLGNESGKININTANAKLLKIMLQSFELMEEEQAIIIDSIQDWRDEDNFHRTNGAEDEYYRTLLNPYNCANRPFQAIEELALVRGMTPAMVEALAKIITVYQEEPSNKSELRKPSKVGKEKAQAKINVNAAPVELLRRFPHMSEGLIEDVVAYRMEKDFYSLNDFKETVGPEVYMAVANFITVDYSPFFTIESLGMVDDSSVERSLRATVFVDNEKKDYSIVEWLDKIQ